MSNSQLDAVLEQAEAAAAAHTPAATTNTTLATRPGPSSLAPLGQPSMDNFMASGGLTVDHFINVKPSGVRVGEMKNNVDRIPVIIDMLEITPLYVCRIETGGNTIFYRSYNGVTTQRGENFQELIALKERAPGAKSSGIYQSVEIPAELAEDLKDAKGTLAIEAGTMIGFTPSLTGFKEFQAFYKKLQRQDPVLTQSRLRVDLVAKTRTNRNNNEWYVLEFDLISRVDD